MNKIIIFLPGLNKQFQFLRSRLNLHDLNILVIGAGSVGIAKLLQEQSQKKIDIIVEDFDSLIHSKLELDEGGKVNIKIMDFERTDYDNEQFDLVYAQGSVSDYGRKHIVKEIKRILKTNGFFCVGEIVKLSNDCPIFVNDIFDNSNLDPLSSTDLTKYYVDRKFEKVGSIDLSFTLKDYYISNIRMLNEKIDLLTDKEKSYYKKVLSKIKHESNAYIKLGAAKFIGFEALLLKKL